MGVLLRVVTVLVNRATGVNAVERDLKTWAVVGRSTETLRPRAVAGP